ncbi:DUF2905 domain-containing protein [Heliorestis convoluta]|uniref:DUF2905 domain-containing protein n=1 Tax=Heliorestis convoluta TaxID=356322 RepID=A0A5Q2MZ35_9FIRM|nr:DUF2905 domain-containing protein [Heliorestis convoluta]QGG46689.1 hypothetical protein FTV88_0510 [Heliorestis convoluta]
MLDGASFGKWIMIIGLGLTLVGGLLWLLSQFISIGRLPGDFSFQKGNMTFYFPLATGLLISLILTILLNLIGRR